MDCRKFLKNKILSLSLKVTILNNNGHVIFSEYYIIDHKGYYPIHTFSSVKLPLSKLSILWYANVEFDMKKFVKGPRLNLQCLG